MQQNYEYFNIKESPFDFLSYKCYTTQTLNILVLYTGIFYIHLHRARTFMGMMSLSKANIFKAKMQKNH